MKSTVKRVLDALFSKGSFHSGNSQVAVEEVPDAPGDRRLTAWGLEVLRVSPRGDDVTLQYLGYSGKHQPPESIALVGEVFRELCVDVLPDYEATLVETPDRRPRAVSVAHHGEEMLAFKESVPLQVLRQKVGA